MRKPHPTLTTQELALMKIVWRRRTATVREVYEDLRETRRIAYTTVMTMMNVLATKGYVTRTKDDRAFRYRPTRRERTGGTSVVREFVNGVFDGASRPLLLHLSKGANRTAKEGQELRRPSEEAE